jgi:hypothetical protein
MQRVRRPLFLLLTAGVAAALAIRARERGRASPGGTCCSVRGVGATGSPAPSLPAAALRLRGGAGAEDAAGREGPGEFRASAKPEDAKSTEDFIRAAQTRDEEMEHPEFLRFAEGFKEGGNGPFNKDIEDTLRELEQDERERYAREVQVTLHPVRRI